MVGIQGPVSEDKLVRLPEEFNVVYGRRLVNYAQILVFLEGLGMHSRHTLQALDDELHRKVLHSIAHLTTSIVEGIVNIQVERNERNNADGIFHQFYPTNLSKYRQATLAIPLSIYISHNCDILGTTRQLQKLKPNIANFVLPIVKN